MTRAPLEAAEVRALGAFRLTGPARTLVDRAREIPLEDAVVALGAALLAGKVGRDAASLRARSRTPPAVRVPPFRAGRPAAARRSAA